MSQQTTYSIYMDKALAGLIGNLTPREISSMRNEEADGVVLFGLGVSQGTANDQMLLPASAGDSIIGFTVYNVGHELPRGGAIATINQNDMLNVMRKGNIYVIPEDTVSKGGAVYVRHTANGAATQLGSVRSDGDAVADAGSDTAAVLTGELDVIQTAATWAAISDGAFDIDVDGVTENVTGCNFSAMTNMSDIAAEIDANFTGSCVWNGSVLVLTNASTGATSLLTVASTPGAGTDISAISGFDGGSLVQGTAGTVDTAGVVSNWEFDEDGTAGVATLIREK